MSNGLYLLRMAQSVNDENGVVLKAELLISLYDGEALKAVVTGDAALEVYAHFLSLPDHRIRDGFIYGWLMGVRARANAAGLCLLPADVLILDTPLSPDARVSA